MLFNVHLKISITGHFLHPLYFKYAHNYRSNSHIKSKRLGEGNKIVKVPWKHLGRPVFTSPLVKVTSKFSQLAQGNFQEGLLEQHRKPAALARALEKASAFPSVLWMTILSQPRLSLPKETQKHWTATFSSVSCPLPNYVLVRQGAENGQHDREQEDDAKASLPHPGSGQLVANKH